MSVKQTHTAGATGGGKSLSQNNTITDNASGTISEGVAASQTDYLVAIVIDITQLQAFYMQSDQDCTVEFNDASVPVPLISLKANEPFVWSKNIAAYFNVAVTEAPFTADITKLYVTNTTALTLDILWIVDPTV